MSNKELTAKEFNVAMNIKVAMNCLVNENMLGTKEYLMAALKVLYNEQGIVV